jgi:hypothetical protein
MPILGSSASQSGKIPGVATINSVTAGDGSVSVAFTEPAYKGKDTITYTATSSPGGFTGTSSSSPITVSGLTNGTSYTFTVTAVSSSGISTSSSASSSVTPAIPQAGYLMGGFNVSAGTRGTTISKVSFATDSFSNLVATLSVGNYYMSGLANSGTAGYSSGGATDSNQVNTIQKLTFGTEQRTTIAATLIQPELIYHSGMANSGTAGYWSGGFRPNAAATFSTIQKITFSNESTSATSATLSTNTASHYSASMANSGTAGYISGGATSAANRQSNIDKLTFSNETRSILSFSYSPYRMYQASFANSGTAGYFIGGSFQNSQSDTIYVSGVFKVPFSNDTVSELGSGPFFMIREGSGFAKSGTAGYIAGGFDSSQGAQVSRIDKLAFSNDSKSTLSATVNNPVRGIMSSFANSGVL